jgi:uncharacterized protein YciI
MDLFIVVNEQGPSWVDSVAMREQSLWTEHAAFVNSLMYAGFIVLGGPIGSGHPHRALLVVRADSESEVRSRLAPDPWLQEGVLRIRSVEPWKILVSLDKLDPILAELVGPGSPP